MKIQFQLMHASIKFHLSTALSNELYELKIIFHLLRH